MSRPRPVWRPAMNKDVPPVDRSISADTLAHHLNTIVRLAERLRLVNEREKPPVPPSWWDDQTKDHTWRDWASNRCTTDRYDRIAYTHWRFERTVRDLLKRFEELAAGADLSDGERRAVADARIGLQAMGGIISSVQSSQKWMWCVAPHESQLPAALPETFTVEGVSAQELSLRTEFSRIACQGVVGELPQERVRNLIKCVHRKLKRLRHQRDVRNRKAARGRVTVERLAELHALVEDWRETIRRWKLAVQSVLRALEVLRGGGGDSAQGADAAASSSKGGASTRPAVAADHTPGPTIPAALVSDTAVIAAEVVACIVPWMDAMFKSKLNECLREARQRRRRSGVPKKAFTQATLSAEIRRIIAEACAELASLRAALSSGSDDKVAAARKRARARFGARAIADRLGVSSHTIVRKNVVWRSELGIPLGLAKEAGPIAAMSMPRLTTQMVADVVADPRVDEPGSRLQIADYSAAERALLKLEACPTADPAVVAAIRKVLHERTQSADDLINLIETYLEDRDPRPLGAGRGYADHRNPLILKALPR